MIFPHGETVTIKRPSAPDAWGDRQPATEFTVSGCFFDPGGSQRGGAVATEEFQNNRNQVYTSVQLYAPLGADIRAIDTIVQADGTRWEVVGDPRKFASPFTGWAPGLQISLEQVRG